MHSPVFDHSVLLTQFGDDLEFVNELIELFLEESPRLLADVQKAVERHDGKAIERTAHRLKASAGKFGMTETVAAAMRLEVFGRKAELADSNAAYQTLHDELRQLQAELAAWSQAEATGIYL